MKPTSINVQITKCPKQYEAVRLGMDASLDAGETVEGAIKAATEQLNALYVEMYQQKPKDAQTGENGAKKEPQQSGDEQPKKEKLKFGDKKLQAIVKRMEKEPTKKEEIFKEALKWFEPDEEAMKTLRLAAKII